MAFIETPRFPEDISYGVNFGPEFSTSIAQTVSGQEIRNRNRLRALCSGDCSHGLKTREQFDNLLKFFRSMGGRFHAFRFKDWSDFSCSIDQGILVATTVVNEFQMYKLYEAAIGFSEQRKISKPIAETVAVFRTRSSATTDVTSECVIDATTGKITISTDLTGDTYTWQGEFDVPCRFDTDKMAVSIDQPTGYTWDQIPVKELLL